MKKDICAEQFTLDYLTKKCDSLQDLIDIVSDLVVKVEKFYKVDGGEKKLIVIKVVNLVVDHCFEDEAQRELAREFVSIILPNLIDTFVKVGNTFIKKTSRCCFPKRKSKKCKK